MEIYHQYVKLRKQFGRWPKVADEGAEMIADVRPNEEHAAAYIERCPVTTCAQVRRQLRVLLYSRCCACYCRHVRHQQSSVTCCHARLVQVVPEMSEHEANTNEVLFSKHNINHEEGGWPKDVDYAEAEHTIRFRKKVEKDEDYINTVAALGARAEARAMQNNAIDIYQRYYTFDSTDIVAEVRTWRPQRPLRGVEQSVAADRPSARADAERQNGHHAARPHARAALRQHGRLERRGHQDRHRVRRHGLPAPARRHEPGLVRVGPFQPQRAGVHAAAAEPGGERAL